MNRAVFLDRDGVINEIVYHKEMGIIDSPFNREQFKIIPKVGEAINNLHQIGFKVIIVSNQPGIAKDHHSAEVFEEIRDKMKEELAKENAFVDDEYYCFHHPDAKIKKYHVICDCRKPKPGMILLAAKDHDIDLKASWMVGDGITDIQAGISAGCKTILIGRMKCELCNLMEDNNAKADYITPNLFKASQVIQSEVMGI